MLQKIPANLQLQAKDYTKQVPVNPKQLSIWWVCTTVGAEQKTWLNCKDQLRPLVMLF